jgi:hypothetical protein
MRSFEGTWFVIGGWAVDIWLGRRSRDHGDVDIGLFRDEEALLFSKLPDWRMVGHDTPDADHDDPWDGSPLGFPAHVHATRRGWPELDFNFNEREGAVWIVQRDPQVAVSIWSALRESPLGLYVLAPELVLWHKARGEIRERDQRDFENLVPEMSRASRAWLARSLTSTDVQHPWLLQLTP